MIQKHHLFGKQSFEECYAVGPGLATVDIVPSRIALSHRDGTSSVETWWAGVLHQPLNGNVMSGLEAIAELVNPNEIHVDTTVHALEDIGRDMLPATFSPDAPLHIYSLSEINLKHKDSYTTLKLNNDHKLNAHLELLRSADVYSALYPANKDGCASPLYFGAVGGMVGATAGIPVNYWCAAIGCGLGSVLAAAVGTLLTEAAKSGRQTRSEEFHRDIAEYSLNDRHPVLEEIQTELALIEDDEPQDRAYKLGRAAGAVFDINTHKPGIVLRYLAAERKKVIEYFRPVADITDYQDNNDSQEPPEQRIAFRS